MNGGFARTPGWRTATTKMTSPEPRCLAAIDAIRAAGAAGSARRTSRWLQRIGGLVIAAFTTGCGLSSHLPTEADALGLLQTSFRAAFEAQLPAPSTNSPADAAELRVRNVEATPSGDIDVIFDGFTFRDPNGASDPCPCRARFHQTGGVWRLVSIEGKAGDRFGADWRRR
jgi:hypothetical protein